jgi:G3E family GTPase
LSDNIPLAFSILTGFLGSGKTTLLNRLLHHEDMANAAVIINEFGEIGLDHLLVETADEDIVVEMSSGCLCCTMRGDLVDTVQGLLARRDAGEIKAFDRIVVETTGLADPAPVLHVAMNHPYLVHRLRLEGVWTTIDAVNGEAALDEFAEAVKQAAVADRIILTKTDMLENQKHAEPLIARLKHLNPTATLLNTAQGEAVPEALFGCGLYNPQTKSNDVAQWLRTEALEEQKPHTHHHDVNRHDDHIKAFCISHDEAIKSNDFNLFIEVLLATYGANLLRIKGIIKLAEQPDRPVVIHGVQHVFHPPAQLASWPDDDHRTRIVFITKDIDEARLSSLLNSFIGAVDRKAVIDAFEQENPLSLVAGTPIKNK